MIHELAAFAKKHLLKLSRPEHESKRLMSAYSVSSLPSSQDFHREKTCMPFVDIISTEKTTSKKTVNKVKVTIEKVNCSERAFISYKIRTKEEMDKINEFIQDETTDPSDRAIDLSKLNMVSVFLRIDTPSAVCSGEFNNTFFSIGLANILDINKSILRIANDKSMYIPSKCNKPIIPNIFENKNFIFHCMRFSINNENKSIFFNLSGTIRNKNTYNINNANFVLNTVGNKYTLGFDISVHVDVFTNKLIYKIEEQEYGSISLDGYDYSNWLFFVSLDGHGILEMSSINKL
jgi:hypothetical protein